MFSVTTWDQIARRLKLSGREFQIVRGTFDDQTEAAIAADLHIAMSTVHTHIGRLHQKLGITDRSQLILRVVQEYLALTAPPGHRRPLINADRVPAARPIATDAHRRFRQL